MALISLNNINLDYYIYGASSRSLKVSLVNALTGGKLKSKDNTLKVEALKGLSFQLNDGDRLGLIGHNGAGKSTLLRVLGKIYHPTNGQLKIEGSTNCLFDVMVGLDPYLSGYENIKLRGIIHGLNSKEIEAKTPIVAEFSGLNEFLHLPINTYSSGMLLRLGFSIVTNFHSDILLIDEVVNVGDANFHEKAQKKMQEIISDTKIVVISTHDNNLIKKFCNKVLKLEKGEMTFFGNIQDYNF